MPLVLLGYILAQMKQSMAIILVKPAQYTTFLLGDAWTIAIPGCWNSTATSIIRTNYPAAVPGKSHLARA